MMLIWKKLLKELNLEYYLTKGKFVVQVQEYLYKKEYMMSL